VKRMQRRNSTSLSERQSVGLKRNLRQGLNLYRTFNRFGPSQLRKIAHSRVIPPIVVQLGELVGLIYRSDKWQAGEPRTYIHFMEDPPHLVCNPEGTQLYVIGGSYRITPQGIEG
jgi:hypothetical protein